MLVRLKNSQYYRTFIYFLIKVEPVCDFTSFFYIEHIKLHAFIKYYCLPNCKFQLIIWMFSLIKDIPVCDVSYKFLILRNASRPLIKNNGKYTYWVFDHFSEFRIVLNIQVLPYYNNTFMFSNNFYGTISQ